MSDVARASPGNVVTFSSGTAGSRASDPARSVRSRKRAQPAKDDVLSEEERRRRPSDHLHELLLTNEVMCLLLEEVLRHVEVLQDVEVDLGLENVETLADHLLDGSLGVRKVTVDELWLADHADDPFVRLDLLLRHGMEVDHRPTRDEKLVDVAQGVHDALTFDSSQRPGEEREIETPAWAFDLCRTGHGERHMVG
jgi:hypothetical protein